MCESCESRREHDPTSLQRIRMGPLISLEQNELPAAPCAGSAGRR